MTQLTIQEQLSQIDNAALMVEKLRHRILDHDRFYDSPEATVNLVALHMQQELKADRQILEEMQEPMKGWKDKVKSAIKRERE